MRIRGKSLYQLWHSLMFTVLRSYGIVLVAFALLVGIIFINLYSDVTMNSYRNQLRRKAEAIAARVSEFVQDDFYGTYPSYLEVLEEMETSDIWIIQIRRIRWMCGISMPRSRRSRRSRWNRS